MRATGVRKLNIAEADSVEIKRLNLGEGKEQAPGRENKIAFQTTKEK